METDKVTRPQRGRTDSSSSEGEQDGMECQLACCESHVAMTPGFLSLLPDLQAPSSKRKKPLNICHWTKTAKLVNSKFLRLHFTQHQLILMQTLCPFRRHLLHSQSKFSTSPIHTSLPTGTCFPGSMDGSHVPQCTSPPTCSLWGSILEYLDYTRCLTLTPSTL